jgi:NAD(P)H-hydrate repair Nnr-like enzyme with NAD(P)H-hydrate epimerase domain
MRELYKVDSLQCEIIGHFNKNHLPINALDIPSGIAREMNLVVVGLALIARNLTI